MTQKKVNC